MGREVENGEGAVPRLEAQPVGVPADVEVGAVGSQNLGDALGLLLRARKGVEPHLFSAGEEALGHPGVSDDPRSEAAVVGGPCPSGGEEPALLRRRHGEEMRVDEERPVIFPQRREREVPEGPVGHDREDLVRIGGQAALDRLDENPVEIALQIVGVRGRLTGNHDPSRGRDPERLPKTLDALAERFVSEGHRRPGDPPFPGFDEDDRHVGKAEVLEKRDRRRTHFGDRRFLERFVGAARDGGGGLRGHVRKARGPKAKREEAIEVQIAGPPGGAASRKQRTEGAPADALDRGPGLVEPAPGLRVENEEMKVFVEDPLVVRKKADLALIRREARSQPAHDLEIAYVEAQGAGSVAEGVQALRETSKSVPQGFVIAALLGELQGSLVARPRLGKTRRSKIESSHVRQGPRETAIVAGFLVERRRPLQQGKSFVGPSRFAIDHAHDEVGARGGALRRQGADPAGGFAGPSIQDLEPGEVRANLRLPLALGLNRFLVIGARGIELELPKVERGGVDQEADLDFDRIRCLGEPLERRPVAFVDIGGDWGSSTGAIALGSQLRRGIPEEPQPCLRARERFLIPRLALQLLRKEPFLRGGDGVVRLEDESENQGSHHSPEPKGLLPKRKATAKKKLM